MNKKFPSKIKYGGCPVCEKIRPFKVTFDGFVREEICIVCNYNRNQKEVNTHDNSR